VSDGPTKTKRKTRTPAERITDLLTTYLGKTQMRTLDAEDKDVLAGVRAAVEYTKEPA
jgi:hypothetical protein